MELRERIAISVSNGIIDTIMGNYLLSIDEGIAGSMLDWLDWKQNQKTLNKYSATAAVFLYDRDNMDYLRGFYDGAKQHNKNMNNNTFPADNIAAMKRMLDIDNRTFDVEEELGFGWHVSIADCFDTQDEAEQFVQTLKAFCR